MRSPAQMVESLDPVSIDRYGHLNHDSLLCYAVKQLESISVAVTFENITVAAFRLFPETFSLVGFLNYPDASRVNRTLLHARPKYRDLIVGNAKSGYALTPRGKTTARQVALDLQGQPPQKSSATSPASNEKRTYTGQAVVRTVEGSALYKHWRDADLEAIGDYEVWDFLEAMPYTDKSMLREIMRNYKEGAELSDRQDIVKFLAWVSERYKHVFGTGGGRG